MGVMRNLNQYLKLRDQRWHYVRRVPKECIKFDDRGLISRSLKTESLEVARARRDALAEADNQYWASISVSTSGLANPDANSVGTQRAMQGYRAAKQRAMAKGFIYTPVHELAAAESVSDILERLQSISVKASPQDAGAVQLSAFLRHIHSLSAFMLYTKRHL